MVSKQSGFDDFGSKLTSFFDWWYFGQFFVPGIFQDKSYCAKSSFPSFNQTFTPAGHREKDRIPRADWAVSSLPGCRYCSLQGSGTSPAFPSIYHNLKNSKDLCLHKAGSFISRVCQAIKQENNRDIRTFSRSRNHSESEKNLCQPKRAAKVLS